MSQAFIPQVLKSHDRVGVRALGWALGLLLMCLLARIVIPLPWTQVPITGQTFGVALLALSGGRRFASSILFTYMGLGAMGLPVFAMGLSGLSFGPTFGYLLGMILASYAVGTLADRGWAKGFWTALGAAYIGSFLIFTCGLFVLSYFVPAKGLWAAGLYPFLFGDFVKNIMAASLATGLTRTRFKSDGRF